MSQHHHSTRADQKAYKAFKAECQAQDLPCWLCGQGIDYDLPKFDEAAFERDHAHPVSTHPELEFDPGNWRPSHRRCNQVRGNNAPRPELGATSRAWFG